MLKSRGSVQFPVIPHAGQAISSRPDGLRPFFSAKASSRVSARKRLWQLRHSINGSLKTLTWPEATHTSDGRIMEVSTPSTSHRVVTIECHHSCLMLSFSATPSGP